MSSPLIWYGSVTSYSSSHVTISNGTDTGNYYGTFSYNNYGLAGGTVTGYDDIHGGVLAFTVRSGNLNALTVNNFLNSGNALGLQQYALSEADTINGSEGNDWLQSWSGNDALYGNSGNDYLKGGSGNDILDGGAGTDTTVFTSNRSNYNVTKTTLGYTVSSNSEGIDTLFGIERLEFADKTIALDIDGNAGQAYRLYQAAFARNPDNGGLKYWISQMDNGATLEQVSTGFLASNEFKSVYGSNPTIDLFLGNLYQNVLHRTPDAGGFDYWSNQIKNGLINEQVLIGFSESNENVANVIGVIQTGIEIY